MASGFQMEKTSSSLPTTLTSHWTTSWADQTIRHENKNRHLLKERSDCMRHFIYLDNDVLLSYYAQAFDGIDEQAILGTTSSTEEVLQNETIERTVTQAGSIKTPVISGSYEHRIRREQPGSIFKENNFAQEVVERKLHDNAFDRLLAYLEDNKMISGITSPKLGSFVLLSEVSQLQDYGYLAKLASDDFKAFLKFAMSSRSEKDIQEAAKTMKPNDLTRMRKNAAKSQELETNKMLEDYGAVFAGLKAVFPFDAFYFGEDFIVPVLEKHFKEPTSQIIHKYGSNVKIFGRITKIGMDVNFQSMGGDALSTAVQAFSTVFNSALTLLGFQSMEKVVMVSPVAVYVE